MRTDYIVDGKPVKLTDADWDCLIILDACRYDKFKKHYKKYFKKGTLKKAISPATHTPEFLYKCFPDKYDDIIYVSGNMFINSKNIPLNHWDSDFEWNPTEHFKRVVDVWDTGFSREKGTILPKEMNKHATVLMDINKKERFIVHYMQPHAPFLTWTKTRQSLEDFWEGDDKQEKSFKQKLTRFAFGHFSEALLWKTANILNRLPEGGRGQLFIQEGREGYIKHYEDNVEIVLAHVQQLIKKYPKKKFLVTADHGDWVGEHGYYGHSKINKRDKYITEVPWYEYN
jgi:hypothetical protein